MNLSHHRQPVLTDQTAQREALLPSFSLSLPSPLSPLVTVSEPGDREAIVW